MMEGPEPPPPPPPLPPPEHQATPLPTTTTTTSCPTAAPHSRGPRGRGGNGGNLQRGYTFSGVQNAVPGLRGRNGGSSIASTPVRRSSAVSLLSSGAADAIDSIQRFKQRGAEHELRLQQLEKAVKVRRKGSRVAAVKNHWIHEATTLSQLGRAAERDLSAYTAETFPEHHDEAVQLGADAGAVRRALLQSVTEVRRQGDSSNTAAMREALLRDLKKLEMEEAALRRDLQPAAAILSADGGGGGAAPTLASVSTAAQQRLEEVLIRMSDTLPHIDLRLVDLFTQEVNAELDKAQKAIEGLNCSPGSALASTAAPSAAASSVATSAMTHDRIETVMRSYSESVSAASRHDVTERLQLEFPGVPRRLVSQELWAWEQRRYSRRAARVAVADAQQRVEALLGHMQEALEERSQIAEAQRKRAEERAEREKASESRRARMEALRAKKVEAAGQRELEALQRQHDEALLREAQESVREAEFAARLQRLAEHNARREEEARALHAREQARRGVEAREEARKAQQNSERVSFRLAEYNDKQHRAKMSQAMREEEALARQGVLEEIAKSVAPVVPRDRDRAVSATVSSQSVSDPRLINESASVQTHGYTVEQVLKDKRFRLAEALSKAGLLNTAYAREVIQGAVPAKASNAGLATHAHNPLHIGRAVAADPRAAGGPPG